MGRQSAGTDYPLDPGSLAQEEPPMRVILAETSKSAREATPREKRLLVTSTSRFHPVIVQGKRPVLPGHERQREL